MLHPNYYLDEIQEKVRHSQCNTDMLIHIRDKQAQSRETPPRHLFLVKPRFDVSH